MERNAIYSTMNGNGYTVNWLWKNGVACYVAAKRTARSGYTSDITLAKKWKTRDAAERWIALRNTGPRCRYEIVEVGASKYGLDI